MAILPHVARTLQELLGPDARAAAAPHGLIQRRRKFTAETLLATFVMGYLRKPDARDADLAATAADLGVEVSPQAVAQRVGPALRDALHDLLQTALTRVVAATPRALPALQSFAAVVVGDSSTLTLAPALAAAYPGTGGDASPAALKLQVQWDLLGGGLALALEPGRQPDSATAMLDRPIPAGALVLRDLAYFHLDRFAQYTADGIHWISRALTQLVIHVDGGPRDFIEWLSRQTADRIDRPVVVGQSRLACRLVAFRLPPDVAAKRRAAAIQAARRRGHTPTARRLAACDWSTYLTNLPAESFDAATIHTLYRVRWQIELLFKLWKSHHHLARHRSDDPVKQLVELSARLLAVLVQHWLLLATGWQEPRLSFMKAARCVRDRVAGLLETLTDGPALAAALGVVSRHVVRCQLTPRRKKPNTVQTLQSIPTTLT